MANNEIKRSLRDIRPAHYVLKVESFSALRDSNFSNHESRVFQASGYKWKLCLYPNGNKKRGVDDHISLYLAIADPETLPYSGDLKVEIKFFVFDYIQEKYLVLQDANEELKRFNRMKTERGFDKLLPLDAFEDPSNGYLEDDCCIFGAEVFVVNANGNSAGECLSTSMAPLSKIHHSWTIKDYASIKQEHLYSDEFQVGDYKWKLQCYPRGHSNAKDKGMSLYLKLVDARTLSPDRKVNADCMLRIKNQVQGKHFERRLEHWFTASSDCRGYTSFISLTDLNCSTKGYMKNNAIIVEVKINYWASTKKH